ncbi:hypothetical protein W822_01730 [Advenella kashmirensis W13003]|uniref:Lysine transporter LysE n=2 Tax=Advenella kashmirensis TaxID=310575 RepID=V8QZ38_9BURK|nr:hypothetical protein W822_01730 [Advenella kashmirensis W13003]
MFGAKKCLYNALGSICASFILIVISLAGIAFFLNGIWMNVLSILGALLLIYVGISGFKNIEINSVGIYEHTNFALFKESFFTGISNPKDIIFFITLLPQFINQSIPYFVSATSLTVGWIIVDFSTMMGYAIIASIIAKKLNQSAINKMRKASGFLIIIIGITLFAKNIFILTYL